MESRDAMRHQSNEIGSTARRIGWRWALALPVALLATVPVGPVSSVLVSPPPAEAVDIYQGFGASTPGGEGKPVVHVTTLADAGPGSLREAVAQGNRTVIFDVAGEILLLEPILVKGSFMTIDGFSGQPAGSPGITLKGNGLYLHGTKGAHDVIVRNIRIRDAANDGLQVKFGAHNIILDHVSVSGSRDGNVDMTRDVHDVTVSWSLFADPVGSATEHSKNFLIKYNPSRITVHHNIFTQAAERNPQIRMDDEGTPAIDTTVDMRNNVVWDWGLGSGTRIFFGPRANVVNNFYSSPNSRAREQKAAIVVCDNGECQGGAAADARAYVIGNVSGDALSKDINTVGTEIAPFPAPVVDTQDACTAARLVLQDAGARPKDLIDEQYSAAVSLAACGSSTPGPGGIADLVPSSMSLPSTVKQDTTFTILETALNAGNAIAGVFHVGIYLSNDQSVTTGDLNLFKRQVEGLPPAKTSTATTPLKLTKPGQFYLGVCVDVKNAVAEANEGNNCLLGGQITVLP